jgi:hypothetical protein
MRISLLDYQRVFRVLYSVLDGTRAATTTKSCLFYGIGGALLLREHYALNATPVAGLALYRVSDGEGQNVIAYCRPEDTEEGSRLVVAQDAFHCWVRCDDDAYDFMAPLFPEIAAEQGTRHVPRRMFVKSMSEMTPSPDALAKVGDFFHAPDLELTRNLVGGFTSRPAYRELLEIARHWFVPNPAKLRRHIDIGDAKLGKVRWQLTDLAVDGSW